MDRRTRRRPGARVLDEDLVLDYTRRLLAENRDELRRADGKAAQGLTVAGAAALAVLTAITSGVWQPTGHTAAQRWAWALAGVLWLVSAGSLIGAMVPRLSGMGDRAQVAYFGHVRHLEQEDLLMALRRAAYYPMPALLSELCWTSAVVITKYRLVRCGFVGFGLAVAAVAATLVL